MSVFKATTVAALTLLLSNASVQSFQPSSYNGRSCSYTELSLAARRPFISGNWKLNPQTRDEAIQLATDIAASVTDTTPSADIALFVPYVFLESTMNVVQKKLMIGAEVSFLYFLLNVCDCGRCVTTATSSSPLRTVAFLPEYIGCMSGNSRCLYRCRFRQYVEFIGCTMGLGGTFRTTCHLW